VVGTFWCPFRCGVCLGALASHKVLLLFMMHMDRRFRGLNPGAVSCTGFWGKFLSAFGHGPRKAIQRPCEYAIVRIGPI